MYQAAVDGFLYKPTVNMAMDDIRNCLPAKLQREFDDLLKIAGMQWGISPTVMTGTYYVSKDAVKVSLEYIGYARGNSWFRAYTEDGCIGVVPDYDVVMD